MIITVPLEYARFRKLERLIIKVHFLSRVTPLKRNVTLGMICSVFPKGSFRNALCCVIDFENTLHGCSLLDNAGVYYPEQPFSTINALPKGVSNSR